MRYILVLAMGVGVSLAPGPARGQGAETAAMISEIRNGRGRVEIRASRGGEWRPAAPLQALRAGDTLRAGEDARAVIVLSGGLGKVSVNAANSPFVVPAPAPEAGKTQKALGLLHSVVTYLSSGAKELPRAVLHTRSEPRPPVILSPRNGPVLPESLAVEWLGSRFSRYSIRIGGPAGPVLERRGVPGARFDYPSGAPALTPGVRYTVQVVGGNPPPQEAWFEVVEPGRAEALRRDLAEMEQALGAAAPPNTVAALRAGFLASHGLMHDARLVLVAALAKDPDEPTLHLLLADIYAKTNLPDQAADSYDEAQFLMTRGTSESPPAKR
jgi:hypothetical protein